MREKLTDKRLQAIKPPAEGYLEVWDVGLPGFGVRVSPKGRKTFICKTRVDGKQRRYSVGTYPAKSLAKGRDDARAIMDQAANGVDYREQQQAERRERELKKRDTFGAVAEAFIEEYAKAKGLRTWRDMQQYLDRDVLPQWRDRPVHEIQRRDVKELLRQKAKTSPASANKVLEVVRRTFNWAMDEEIVDHNPALRMVAPAPKVERERVLTDTELRLFWIASGQQSYPFGPLHRLACLTAQRRGEVAAMRWSEVDMEAGTWTLPGTTAKGGVGHLVPLSPLAIEQLQACPRLGEFVFPSPHSSRPADQRTEGERPVSGFSKAKRRLDKLMADQAEREGMGAPAEWRVHDLRRTAATRMRGLGADRLTVSKVLNHSEAGVTRIYDRFSMDPEKRRALDSWASYVQRLLQPAGSNVVGMR